VTADFDTIVIGAGPIGLTAALLAARNGRVLLCETGAGSARVRVDSVPVSLLAFFIELGLHPIELGASIVHNLRLVAWGGAKPVASMGAGSVHVLRPRLDQALLAKVRSHPRIAIRRSSPPTDAKPQRRIFDATGRRALTAKRVIAPPDPAICRSVFIFGSFAPAQQALRIASLPGGYAYRLGTADTMTIGLVLGGSHWGSAAGSIVALISGGGAGWLFAGLPAIDDAVSGRGGIASVQWSVGASKVARLGDAEFARDALAGQGMATGISAALRTILDWEPPDCLKAIDDRIRHLQTLQKLVSQCQYVESPFWQSYGSFLSLHTDSETQQMMHSSPRPARPAAVRPDGAIKETTGSY
jgi:flavin-dependent dehydrogenase